METLSIVMTGVVRLKDRQLINTTSNILERLVNIILNYIIHFLSDRVVFYTIWIYSSNYKEHVGEGNNLTSWLVRD